MSVEYSLAVMSPRLLGKEKSDKIIMGAILLVRSCKTKTSFPKTITQGGRRRRNQTFLPSSPCARDSGVNTECLETQFKALMCNKAKFLLRNTSGLMSCFFLLLYSSKGTLCWSPILPECCASLPGWMPSFVSQFSGYLFPHSLSYPQ